MAEEWKKAASPDGLHAVLRCVSAPSKEQEEKFVSFLRKHYGTDKVELTIRRDPSIGGGFILEIGSEQYDWSRRGIARQFERRIDEARAKARADSPDRVIPMLRDAVDHFHVLAQSEEVGEVVTAGDGIVTIDGLEHVQYGEIVLFENGVKGMVQNIGDDGVGAILFDEEGTIGEGSRVIGTGKRAGIPVSEEYLGRVVNALGAPIDGGDPITADEYRAIEQKAPGIVERKSVSVPLATGILSIDSMFPIGRGQRELIIGDRQTGKTGHDPEPEGEGLHLRLRRNRPEGIDDRIAREHPASERRHGLHNCRVVHRVRPGAAPVYCTVRGNVSRGIFHAQGTGRSHCLR